MLLRIRVDERLYRVIGSGGNGSFRFSSNRHLHAYRVRLLYGSDSFPFTGEIASVRRRTAAGGGSNYPVECCLMHDNGRRITVLWLRFRITRKCSGLLLLPYIFVRASSLLHVEWCCLSRLQTKHGESSTLNPSTLTIKWSVHSWD